MTEAAGALELDRAALILIDLQNGFCDPAGSVGSQGRDVRSMTEAAQRGIELAKTARRAGIPVIWMRYELREDYRDSGHAIRTLRPAMRENGALKANSWDAELWRPDEVAPEDFVITKTRVSSLLGTSLELLLHDQGITTTLIGGVTTSMCVETTVRDLAQRDYDVRVVTDAVADFDQERHTASLRAMQFGFAKTTTAAEVADLLSTTTSAAGLGPANAGT